MTFQWKRKPEQPSASVRAQPARAGGPMRAMAGLQQSLGNRGMRQLIAHTVQMKRGGAQPVQRAAEAPELEEEELQMKRGAAQPAQRKAGGDGGMPTDVRERMEQAFGTGFSDVMIHTDEKASQVGALAYTQGNDIHFAPGQYRPDTKSGRQLLGHELAHVVQQRQGRVQPTGEVNGMPLNDDVALEAEADRLGNKAAEGQ